MKHRIYATLAAVAAEVGTTLERRDTGFGLAVPSAL